MCKRHLSGAVTNGRCLCGGLQPAASVAWDTSLTLTLEINKYIEVLQRPCRTAAPKKYKSLIINDLPVRKFESFLEGLDSLMVESRKQKNRLSKWKKHKLIAVTCRQSQFVPEECCHRKIRWFWDISGIKNSQIQTTYSHSQNSLLWGLSSSHHTDGGLGEMPANSWTRGLGSSIKKIKSSVICISL